MSRARAVLSSHACPNRLTAVVNPALDSTDRNRELIGCLAIFHAPEVNQLHGGSQLLGQSRNRLANPFSPFIMFQSIDRIIFLASQQIDQ